MPFQKGGRERGVHLRLSPLLRKEDVNVIASYLDDHIRLKVLFFFSYPVSRALEEDLMFYLSISVHSSPRLSTGDMLQDPTKCLKPWRVRSPIYKYYVFPKNAYL